MTGQDWKHQLIQRICLGQSIHLIIGRLGIYLPSASHSKDKDLMIFELSSPNYFFGLFHQRVMALRSELYFTIQLEVRNQGKAPRLSRII